MITKDVKLVDNCSRKPLIEGRNYGISFALCKRDGDTFTTVGPLSPCKDYVNDQVYSEMTGKPFGAYGYHATKQGLLEDDNIHIAIGILPYKSGGDYGTQAEDTKYLNECANHIENFVNDLPHAGAAIIHRAGDNRIVLSLPKWWGMATYRISLLTLFIRTAVEGKFDSDKSNALDFLKESDTDDKGSVQTALKKLDKIGKEQNFERDCFWHDEGIVTAEL